MKPNLLIVDDDEEIRTQVKWALSEDYEVVVAEDRPSAVKVFGEARPLVVLMDLGLPPNPGAPDEGLAALAEIRTADPMVKVIIVSGQNEREIAMRAISDGAFDFISKPVQLDELRTIVKRSFYVANLEREYAAAQQAVPEGGFEGLLGTSDRMQQVFTAIRRVATTDAPVLILGESGTGKEMAARAIHRRSRRKRGPFIAINCGAIPETLLESELFGHEKGSFTGAHTQRPGRIESAAGGTLFLDELGELPPPLQVKLLRFLQDQRIERVGGRVEIPVDTRVIAATNLDLQKAMVEGRFREDLYYRLAVVVIKLPALRERETDVELLAKSLLQRYVTEHRRESLKFAQTALCAINQHTWPGNVRELENRIKRAVIMAEASRITPEDLELEYAPAGSGEIRSLKEAREALERDMVFEALRRHGKISRAADELGVSRPTLYELMEKLGIRKEEVLAGAGPEAVTSSGSSGTTRFTKVS
ncbi:MAG TPA: PEP-CTERM-box response regulator transcription factor [Methylomirabilota bacterium]|nr:PEP-CTERM-box response regulator transcription factor [Methylomirabilota bacterium]